MEVLKRSLASELFAEKLVMDGRDPAISFSVPGIDGKWGIFAPLWEHWRQLILVGVRTVCFGWRHLISVPDDCDFSH